MRIAAQHQPSMASRLPYIAKRTPAHFLQPVSLILCLIYVLVLPGGMTGLLLGLFSLLLICLAITRQTLFVALVLVLPTVFGLAIRAFGVPYGGGVLLVLIGCWFMVRDKSYENIAKTEWRSPALWLAFTFMILALSYMYGPQTLTSLRVLVYFLIAIVSVSIAVNYLADNPGVNLLDLGLVAVVSSVVNLGAICVIVPEAMPQNIWTPFAIRAANTMTGGGIARNTVGFSAGLGLIFLSVAASRGRLGKREIFQIILAAPLAIALIASAGQRLVILSVSIAVTSLFAVRKASKTAAAALILFLVITVLIIVAMGNLEHTGHINKVMASDAPLPVRINRSTNWDAAIKRFIERPILGHGLGGYYIEGLSDPGSGTFSHSLVLGLLSETGIVGTALILGPLIAFCIIPLGKQILSFQTAGGHFLLPLITLLFIFSMAGGQISGHPARLFAILAVVWAHGLAERKRSARLQSPRIPVN